MQMLTPAIQSVKHGGPFVQKFYTSDRTKMTYVDMADYAEAAAEIIASGAYTYGTYGVLHPESLFSGGYGICFF